MGTGLQRQHVIPILCTRWLPVGVFVLFGQMAPLTAHSGDGAPRRGRDAQHKRALSAGVHGTPCWGSLVQKPALNSTLYNLDLSVNL